MEQAAGRIGEQLVAAVSEARVRRQDGISEPPYDSVMTLAERS